LSLVFRSGTKAVVPAVARLALHSFPNVFGSAAEWEALLLDSPLGGVETLWVGEESGQVLAACRLYRFQQWIGGTAIPIMGLGMVAISATGRRRGLAARLVSGAFEHCRQRGDLATALYPFRTSFYARLGYGMAGGAHQFQIPPRALADDPGRLRVALVESAGDRSAVAAVYQRWAPTQTGQLVRPERAWERVWEGDTRHGVLYRDEGGEAAGYLIFRYHSGAARGTRFVEVEEGAWLTTAARRGLYGWLASLGDQWDQIVYRAHPDEAFAEHLLELRHPIEGVPRWHFWFPAATAMAGPMFRLLDLPGGWRARSLRPGEPMTLALEVHDADVPENGGGWTLRMEAGRVEVARGGSGPADVRMRTGIEPLSRIFIGSLLPTAAVDAGLATVDHPGALGALDALLALPKPWMFDRF
jgi:predicted acetyltransferase